VYALSRRNHPLGEFSPVCKAEQWLDDDHTTFTGDKVWPRDAVVDHVPRRHREPGK